MVKGVKFRKLFLKLEDIVKQYKFFVCQYQYCNKHTDKIKFYIEKFKISLELLDDNEKHLFNLIFHKHKRFCNIEHYKKSTYYRKIWNIFKKFFYYYDKLLYFKIKSKPNY